MDVGISVTYVPEVKLKNHEPDWNSEYEHIPRFKFS